MKVFDESKNWYKGNLHTHTRVSDGRMEPKDVIELYRSRGYDFLALTDHRRMSYPEMNGNMLLMGGVEFDYTLADQVMHIIGIGLTEAPALPLPDNGKLPQEGIDAITAAGGMAILAHPAWSLNTLDAVLPLHGLSAMEIMNTVSGVPWNGDRADASAFCDMAFTHGSRLSLVASDDAHFYDGDACRSYTMVNCDELSLGAIKDAIRAGRCYASQGPAFRQITLNGDELTVDCSLCATAVVLSNSYYVGHRVMRGNLTHFTYKLAKSDRYVRVMLDDGNGNRAWSGAIDCCLLSSGN